MKTLITEEQLREGIGRMAHEIAEHYGDRPLTMVGVMIGSVMVLADLIRLLEMPLRVELVQGRNDHLDRTRPGPLVLNLDLLSTDVRGRDVLLVDDIFDTGHTLSDLVSQLDELEPSSIRTAVLLRKQGRCEVSIQPDFVGFDIPDAFVVGYGLDHNDRYRNLPYVAALDPAEIARESTR